MKARKYFQAIKFLLLFVLMNACVERIEFDLPSAHSQIVIEGMIHDGPGPYTVKISSAMALDAQSTIRRPVEHAIVQLFDDEGNVESFTESSPGNYITAGHIQGLVGHAYHIRVQTLDGTIYESEPEMIYPVGEIEDIRYEFEARTIVESYGEIRADVFNIYVDANAGIGRENYVRWKFTGTYKVETYPKFRMTHTPPYSPYKNPPPCSGYIVVEFVPGGKLEKIADCTCCVCWANHFEPLPQLSDTQLIEANQFKNIKVGEVSINNVNFYDKYMVEVEQMSLSRSSFQFFKLAREQKAGASNLFQAPAGEIRGNLRSMNSDDVVIGLFWASSIHKREMFIYPEDVPYRLTPMPMITDPCYDYFPDSFTEQPDHWE